jgi:hypothetical protein
MVLERSARHGKTRRRPAFGAAGIAVSHAPKIERLREPGAFDFDLSDAEMASSPALPGLVGDSRD